LVRFPKSFVGKRPFDRHATAIRSHWLVRNGAAAMTGLTGPGKKIQLCLGQTTNHHYSTQQPVNSSVSSIPDTTLVRIAAGDHGAMKECISTYGNLVWAIVRRYVKDVTEAEDVVQEIFTEIWKKADRYNPDASSASTFIGLIARRRSIDHLRRKSRQPEFDTLEAAEYVEASSGERAPALCDPEAVKSSVAVLPDDTRRLFQLFFEDGYTHPEIAEKTGIPLGTVKTRLRRGLIILREHLRRAVPSNIQPAS
jgi:RNA polymerase sigma-70 factor, ECF subfamily